MLEQAGRAPALNALLRRRLRAMRETRPCGYVPGLGCARSPLGGACDALRGWEATLSPRLTRGLDTDQTCSVLSVRASCARFGSSLRHLRAHGFPGSPACGSRRVRQCYATEVLSLAAQPLNSGGPA